MDCSVAFYPTEEKTKHKVVIKNMPFDASHDTIETNNVDFQSMQEGVVTQIGKRKKSKVDIPPIPPNVTTNDATCISTPIDVDKSFSFSQQVSIVLQQPVGPS